MRALSCQSARWSRPVELLTCVYWTRPAPHYPGRTPCLPPFFFHYFFLFLSISFSLFCQYCFYFLKPFSTFPPSSSPRCPVQFIFSGSPLLVFPLSLFSHRPFLFCIIFSGPLCQSFGLELPSQWRRCSSLLCTWLSTRTPHGPTPDWNLCLKVANVQWSIIL